MPYLFHSREDIAGHEEAKEVIKEAVTLPLYLPHIFVGAREKWKVSNILPYTTLEENVFSGRHNFNNVQYLTLAFNC